MKKQTYTPSPVSTDDVELSDELNELTELIASNVHDIWAEGRIAEGWVFGELRDDNLKTHPCLVPYNELPENEKEYDRNTAMKTLKMIHKLGFRIVPWLLVLVINFISCGNPKITIVSDDSLKKVDILYDGKIFTSYIYPDDLEKPVLYPIHTSNGTIITRGFPLDPRPFERTDHPHHVGLWFNFGDVNGIDFWNNSFVIPEERKFRYGSVRHKEIVSIKGNTLSVCAHWVDFTEHPLLKEETTFKFSGKGNWRTIERLTKLYTLQDTVVFTDNKEGLIAIRMDRAFEEPSNKPERYLDAEAQPLQERTVNDDGKNGVYRNSEGLEKEDVWGKPTKWVSLSGEKDGEEITVAIVDHKDNPGYPAYSHARGYGLFSTNNMGQQAFDKNVDLFVLKLNPGESITFKHLIVVKTNGYATNEMLKKIFDEFNE